MSLPPTLYIQADNSAKDNKNFILMGFLASLVQQNIFKKVIIYLSWLIKEDSLGFFRKEYNSFTIFNRM